MPDQFDPDPLLLPGKSPADPNQAAGFLGGGAATALGIPEAIQALRGQMTPEEGQNFFMNQVPSLLGPEGKSLAALGLVPRKLLPKLGSNEALNPAISAYIPGQTADTLFGHMAQHQPVHSFDIANEAGTPVGRTWITQHPEHPNSLQIEMIQALDPKGNFVPGWEASQVLGPREIRSLLPELKKHFPEADRVSGYRTTGARFKTGKAGETQVPIKGKGE